MEWLRLECDWVEWMRFAGRSAGTIRLRRHQVAWLAARARGGPDEVTTAELVELVAAQSWSPETRHSHRAGWIGFYSWAIGQGLLEDNPAARLPAVMIPRALPRPATDDLLQVALARADERTRLMLLLAAHAGLRVCEVARVHARDVVRDVDGPALRVRGKGGRERRVPVSDEMAIAVRLAACGSWAFPSPAGGPLTAGHVGKIIARALDGQATAHQLRHRFATKAYAADRDLRAVQELLGHARSSTTERYTALPTGAARRAALAAAS